MANPAGTTIRRLCARVCRLTCRPGLWLNLTGMALWAWHPVRGQAWECRTLCMGGQTRRWRWVGILERMARAGVTTHLRSCTTRVQPRHRSAGWTRVLHSLLTAPHGLPTLRRRPLPGCWTLRLTTSRSPRTHRTRGLWALAIAVGASVPTLKQSERGFGK